VTTREAITALARQIKDELMICTTGYTCRDVQAACDRPGNFYMIGSMGLAASMGLGIALVKPKTTVVVFDGDGAVLMGLGNLAMAGALKPRNFVHAAFDNEVFASTGRQPTYSKSVSLEAVAAAAGYPVVRRAQTPEEITAGWGQICARLAGGGGPAFFLIKCEPDPGPPMERIRMGPEAITTRFMEAVGT